MARCSKYIKRFKKALEFRDLPLPKEIIETLAKRAKSDRELDNIIHSVCVILEPPYCQKSHCHSHTAFGFCGCSEGLVPGKCKLNLEYLKRKKEREENQFNERVSKLPAKYLPLSEFNKTKIREMDNRTWNSFVAKQKIN